MKKQLSEWQKNTIEQLLNQYENSKTYRGKNQVTQTFSIVPAKIFDEYDSDFADINLIHDFEQQMKELEEKELVFVKWKSHVIEKMIANPGKWVDYYELLGRKERYQLEQEQIKLYQAYLGIQTMLNCFCEEQIRRIEGGKKAEFPAEEACKILRLWKFLIENQEEILERELSIAVLGDSKLWERTYCVRLYRLLKRYGNFEELLLGVDDEKEATRIILAEYHVVPNPSFIYFKGDAELTFTDGQKLRININMPVAFTEQTLGNLKKIIIFTPKVMTVENLTSFNRLSKKDSFYIFLSGYHNRLKQQLLQKIYKDNKMKKWLHFGDIDPDGFYIIEHLKRGTGIPFEPVYMGTNFLEKYDSYTKPLTDNDLRKAKTLQQQEKYGDVMEYMLREKKKLEQEIISWKERD